MTTISWINAGSGDWSNGANWSGGEEPGATDLVALSGTDAYTVTLDVADSILGLTLSDASAALVLDQTLSLQHTLSVTGGSVQIEGGGGLSGGTLAVGAAGSAVLNGGSLSNVRVDGTLIATDANSVLTGKISFAGIGGSGSGVFDYDYGNFYADNYIYAVGNTTLSGATMNIGNTGTGGSVNILDNSDAAGTGATLTLAANFILNEVAGNSALVGTDGSNDAIVNDGTIDATTGGGDLQIDATRFIDKGTIATANGGVVFFTGSMSAKLLDSVTIGSGGYAGIDGTVTGGTLVTPDGQIGSYGGSGELDGTTVWGTLTIGDGGFTLAGKNGFAGASGTGTATLNFDEGNYYSANYLTALGSQTLNNAVLNIGNTGTGGSINILQSKDATGSGATLTLGAGFTLNEVAGNSALVGSDGAQDAIVNFGTIDATTGGGDLQIDATTFSNKGVIDTANGGVVFFTGAMNAYLLDSVTVGSGGYLGIDGTVTGGTLVTPDGQIGSYGGSGELDGTTVWGTLTIEDGGFTLAGKNGFAGTGGTGVATLNFDQGSYYSADYLTALGSQTLNNAVLNIGNTGSGGSINILQSKDPTGSGATLTLGDHFTLNEVAGNSALVGSDGTKDAIVNFGTIDATTAGGNLQIDATTFSNKGVIDTANGGVVFFTGPMNAKLLDSVTVGSDGYLGIDGTVTGGTLVTPDGQIGSWGGSGELDGTTVWGTLTIQDSGFTLAGKNGFAGINGSGDATLNFELGSYYSANDLTALGSQTLNDVVLNIGNTGLGASTNILFSKDASGTGAVLRLGSGFILNAVQGNSGIAGTDGSGDSIINGGTIEAVTSDAYLQIDATKFSNNGVIETGNGGVVYFTGKISAGLIDSVKNGAGGYTGIDGTVKGGTIVSPDGQVGSINGNGVLDGVTVQGTLTIEDDAFTLEGANTFAGVGGGGGATLNFDQGLSYATSYLYADGNETLNNVLLNIGNTGLGGSTNELFNQDTTGKGATLTLGSGFTLNAEQGNSEITGTDGAGDAIINHGTIDVETNGAVLTIDETKFTNDGVINVGNGGTLNMIGTSAAAGGIALGSGGSIVMNTAHGLDATISGFGADDTIMVTGQAISSVLWVQSSATGGTLQLIGAGGILGDLSLHGSYAAANFAVSADMHHIGFVAASPQEQAISTARLPFDDLSAPSWIPASHHS